MQIEEIKENANFQLNSCQLFLTYPHCSLSHQEALEQLQRTFHILQYCIAIESHSDGTPHLHCYLKLDKSYPHRWRNARFADLRGPNSQVYHGNYQGARSVNAVLGYVRKDANFLSNIDLTRKLRTGVNRAEVGAQLLGKRSLTVLVKENPALLFGYAKLKLDLLTFQQDDQDSDHSLPPFLPNPWGLVLPSYKNSKRRHYWLWSVQPNVGKTFKFAKPLRDEFGVALISSRPTYWNVVPSTKCIILDEFNFAWFKFYELNSLCDGTFSFRRFQQGELFLKDPLIIVLSNNSISSLYPHMNNLLYERFNEKKLD